jgi:RNA polymerase sigma-70 factor, ECF subfamily
MTRRGSSSDEIRALYETHGRALLAYAWSLLRDVAAAEDMLHQVFTRLLRGDLVIVGTPLPYLCRAVRNAALNHRRGHAREDELGDHAVLLEAPGGLEEAGLAIQQALAALPAEQREVVALHVWGRMTFQEIADALDVSPNTVASRYRYGLSKLRELLKPLAAR